MYICLTGAKKNLGDFLITDRSLKLLKNHKPDEEFKVLPHWKEFSVSQLEKINSSKGIIILGGPGYRREMYPGIYKLFTDLDKIKVPIIPLGLGWKSFPGDLLDLKGYRFSGDSLRLLNKMRECVGPLSCRDPLSATVLEKNGFPALMTGCPAWYRPEGLPDSFLPPAEINSIAFTPPQLSVYHEQSVKLLLQLSSIFPNAKFQISFHRGLSADEFTTEAEADSARALAEKLQALSPDRISIHDTSYDLDRITFYSDCDLHVGYRVHAHIHFLSRLAPSILINEDGRGRGVQSAFSLSSIDGWRYTFFGKLSNTINSVFIRKAIGKIFSVTSSSRSMVEQTKKMIEDQIGNDWIGFSLLRDIINSTEMIMKGYIDIF